MNLKTYTVNLLLIIVNLGFYAIFLYIELFIHNIVLYSKNAYLAIP